MKVNESDTTEAFADYPSPQTLFRGFLSPQIRRKFKIIRTFILWPVLWWRDLKSRLKVLSAKTAKQNLAILPEIAGSLAEAAWEKKMIKFGKEGIEAMKERLCATSDDTEIEKIIAALYASGEEGGKTLLEVFDKLEIYAKSLACVAFGQLSMKEASGKIWRFFKTSKNIYEDSFVVGAMWGLIDLEDKRVSDAALALLKNSQRYSFSEFFDFVGLACDQRAIKPLLAILMKNESDAASAQKALFAILSRVSVEEIPRSNRRKEEIFRLLSSQVLQDRDA